MDRLRDVRERIRKLRVERGYSQEYMSIQLDVSLRQYQRLESGTRDWSLKQLIQLAEVFDMPVYEMVNYSRDPTSEYATERQMRLLIDRLDVLNANMDTLFPNRKKE
ncbi:helix-turn-helix domain-containing protein [Phaeocystidibacter luteus]|uniref:Helix-turn-helix transcriptional regulator n=1 Tax=Phaeocystidibacter luteus TaxID=911197 RepID=A0A6N6REL2_9FLAO|nr:helix-turn-helix transcriptional regulator [Phaeocystidibacter luteus]KAB2808637.1 helix-turn-helix transcriptional regulator [Phaeocystidibacter luteus]